MEGRGQEFGSQEFSSLSDNKLSNWQLLGEPIISENERPIH